MTNKIALVTGASSGIGAATVHALLAEGLTVYAGARRMDRMESLRVAGARLLMLDVTDDASIIAAIQTISAEHGGLDVLVNNAGYGSYGALEDVPLHEARRQFEVNVFGASRLIQLALPAMRQRRAGRIVNVSSVAGKVWEPFGSWYHASKFALEGLSDCLRVELRPFGIDVVLIEPGAIRTEWNGIAADSLVAVSGETDYGPYARRYAEKALRGAYKGKLVSPPEVVAATIVSAVKARRPKTRYAIGGGAGLVLFLKRMLGDRGFDNLMWNQAKG